MALSHDARSGSTRAATLAAPIRMRGSRGSGFGWMTRTGLSCPGSGSGVGTAITSTFGGLVASSFGEAGDCASAAMDCAGAGVARAAIPVTSNVDESAYAGTRGICVIG